MAQDGLSVGVRYHLPSEILAAISGVEMVRQWGGKKKTPPAFSSWWGFEGFRVGIGGLGVDSVPKPLEIHLSGFVVRRIGTYVEDFCDGSAFTADLACDGYPVRERRYWWTCSRFEAFLKSRRAVENRRARMYGDYA
jgi:hypothetical protein